MSDIPAARLIVSEIRARIEAGTLKPADAVAMLNEAERMMWREPPAKPRAAPSGKRCDAQMAERIRRYAQAHPKKSEVDIARHFGLNSQGRVSEALHHLR